MKLKLKPASVLKRQGSAFVTGLAVYASHPRHRFLRVDFLFLRFDHFSLHLFTLPVFSGLIPQFYFFCLPAMVANSLGPLDCSV